jgi:hypothetical protein
MKKQLVFVHGRSQQGKDPQELKDKWIEAWKRGLAKNNLTMPISEDQIRFPFYGDTLSDMVDGKSAEDAAAIIVKGATEGDAESVEMLTDILYEFIRETGVTEAEIETAMGPDAVAKGKGPQNWGWVQAVLRTIDSKTPGGGALIALVTNDVHQFLTKDRLREHIQDGVTNPLDFGKNDANGKPVTLEPGTESVVVSHSLGTIVAYTLLHRRSEAGGGKVPLFVTLGSPLAIRAIRAKLAPLGHPACVGKWFNAMDPKDVVSLYPLDQDNFGIDPEIENKTDVKNSTPNKHGIAGYLDDPVIARRIYDALV